MIIYVLLLLWKWVDAKLSWEIQKIPALLATSVLQAAICSPLQVWKCLHGSNLLKIRHHDLVNYTSSSRWLNTRHSSWIMVPWWLIISYFHVLPLFAVVPFLKKLKGFLYLPQWDHVTKSTILPGRNQAVIVAIKIPRHKHNNPWGKLKGKRY